MLTALGNRLGIWDIWAARTCEHSDERELMAWGDFVCAYLQEMSAEKWLYTMQTANHQKRCQAFSSWGIAFAKCLMVRSTTRIRKRAFDKMVVFS